MSPSASSSSSKLPMNLAGVKQWLSRGKSSQSLGSSSGAQTIASPSEAMPPPVQGGSSAVVGVGSTASHSPSMSISHVPTLHPPTKSTTNPPKSPNLGIAPSLHPPKSPKSPNVGMAAPPSAYAFQQTGPMEQAAPKMQTIAKKTSLSDLIRFKKEQGGGGEEDGQSNKSRGTTGSGSTQRGPAKSWDMPAPSRDQVPRDTRTPPSTDRSDVERTPKARGGERAPQLEMELSLSSETSFMNFSSPASPSYSSSSSSASPQPQNNTLARPVLQQHGSSGSSYPSSTTPDMTSSLDDNQPRSTTASTTSLSSEYTDLASSLLREAENAQHPPIGLTVLDRLEDNLSRASRSPMWAKVIDEPPRKLVISSPVLQVVNANVVKDRFLLLFTDVLVIAKPILEETEMPLTDVYDRKPNLDKRFVVKSVVPLRGLRFTGERRAVSGQGMATGNGGDPAMKAFVSGFAKDPQTAISHLLAAKQARDDPVALGRLLFHAVDLDKVRLGEYLSHRTSRVVLKAYIDSLGLKGLRIDRALRAFFSSLVVPMKSARDYTMVEYFLDAVASRWYAANMGIINFDKDLTIRLARALFQLNELAQGQHGHGHSRTNSNAITATAFMEAFRRYDPRLLISDIMLEDMYHSITQERLRFFSHDPSSIRPEKTIPIIIKRPLPARLTYKILSDPIVVRIPAADPNLTIHLYGQHLTFEPPVLNFARSPEASFRVLGTALGSYTVIMVRSGVHAMKYSGLPLSSTVNVERAFMRNTFQVAFANHEGKKRRLMFGVEDSVARTMWVDALARQVDASIALDTGSG